MTIYDQEQELEAKRESVESAWAIAQAALDRTHVVICLGGLSVHVNGSPMFSCKAYGPFTAEEVEEKAKGIQRLEGGAVCIRPLVDLDDTYRRISAD